MILTKIDLILEEVQNILSQVNNDETESFIQKILSANKIVVAGAGRVGLAGKGFAMRLGHLGKNTYTIGDSTTPAIGIGDLLIVASGSGETQTIYDLVVIAQKNKADIALITNNPTSRMGLLASVMIVLSAPSKQTLNKATQSKQPMTTLNEQCLALLFDALVLELMDKMGETHETMWARHSNLE